jgi:uncharacterized membrane protein YfcA
MLLILVSIVAFAAAIMTFFSGFGLGTILTPFFCLFFSVQEAIALTAIVHFANNIFKFSLLKKHIDYNVALPFALTAVLMSFAGAEVLNYISFQKYEYTYDLLGITAAITPVKIVVALLMIVFVVVELIPEWSFKVSGRISYLIGGMFSGFFGGLSGNQGALRSMFLLKAGLSKESYIATGVLIACLVDISRLSVYTRNWNALNLDAQLSLMIVAVIAALGGSLLGKKYIQKITMKSMQRLIVVFLSCIALLLGSGIL